MKTKLSIVVIITTLLFGLRESTAQDPTAITEGMIKVAIYYPNGEGYTFDMEYYMGTHMPMAADLFGDALKAMVIDKGLSGGAPGTPSPYMAIGYFYFADMETCQNQMGLHSATLRADVPNYTNIRPVVQISEVVLVD